MVPVSWALASADVNAGTARAARIAIIAITTSNSISVNADQNLFSFIFIVGFFNWGCSEGFFSAGAVHPNRLGDCGQSPLPFLILRGVLVLGCSGNRRAQPAKAFGAGRFELN